MADKTCPTCLLHERGKCLWHERSIVREVMLCGGHYWTAKPEGEEHE